MTARKKSTRKKSTTKKSTSASSGGLTAAQKKKLPLSLQKAILARKRKSKKR